MPKPDVTVENQSGQFFTRSRMLFIRVWCFRDPIRVPRMSENYHRVPRVREIGTLESEIRSLQVHTGYLTFSLKKNLLLTNHEFQSAMSWTNLISSKKRKSFRYYDRTRLETTVGIPWPIHKAVGISSRMLAKKQIEDPLGMTSSVRFYDYWDHDRLRPRSFQTTFILRQVKVKLFWFTVYEIFMIYLPLLCGRPEVLQGGYSFEVLQGYAFLCARVTHAGS